MLNIISYTIYLYIYICVYFMDTSDPFQPNGCKLHFINVFCIYKKREQV